jgi:hypothetical protein
MRDANRIDRGPRRERVFDTIRGVLVLAVVIGTRYVRLIYVLSLGNLVAVRSLIAGGGAIAARIRSASWTPRRIA